MSGYRVAPKALAQLADIYAFSKRRWGEAKAEEYVGGLFTFFAAIARGEVQTRHVAGVGGGGAYAAYRAHHVFWRPADQGIAIVAVLHQRMDLLARLTEATTDWPPLA